MRESSKRLSRRYKFKRTLATSPGIVKDLHERDERVNRVQPVKDILIWEPMALPPFPPSPNSPIAADATMDTPPEVRISKHNTNWPFRIEFIEQLLDVRKIWVVVADGNRPNRSYASSSGAAIPHNVGGINLDMVAINKPKVVVGGIGHYRKPIIREKELRELEKGIRPAAMIYGSDSVWIEGDPNECIDIYLCNILPRSLTMYNCAFYHRDVAHLYLDSLAEHIKRFVNSKS